MPQTVLILYSLWHYATYCIVFPALFYSYTLSQISRLIYIQALMQAVPIPDPREQDQCKVLEGEIPSPMDLPSGCPFCARCKKALAICKEIRPQMAETADGHQVACHLYTDGGKQ